MTPTSISQMPDECDGGAGETLAKRSHSTSNLTKHPFKQPASKYDFVKVITISLS